MNRQLFLRHVAQTSSTPLMLEIVKADGCWMFDVNGKKFLDMISGIAVSNVGHNNQDVKLAITNQLDKYSHLMVYGEFVESPQVQFATWIAAHMPAQLDSVYFVNSGSEAIEGALKLAKRVTGRPEIISFYQSYHGSTMGALSAGNTEERKNAFRPLIPDNTVLSYNNFDQINLITEKTAAVLIEPIQAEAGVILPQSGYLQAIRNKCDETGTLLIFDECQTGFGRTGKLFAWEHSAVVPDIITLGKAIGGGLPLGAFVASQEKWNMFTHAPMLGHLTTFGGHPISCAAGLAAANFTITQNLVANSLAKAERIVSKLQHHKIKQIRNSGLFFAIELSSVEVNMTINKKLIEAGLIVDWFLFAANCLRLAPPLTIADDEIDYACDLILSALND
ncbi:MAG: aspartate aminotransferase family protein [Chitinophagales bacterium]|nr:aspartate aminotransferase family protein [Chitinophagales bacterium]